MMLGQKAKDRLIGSIIPILLIVIWEFSVFIGWLPKTLIASPSQITLDFWRFIVTGELFEHIFISLYRLLVGFIVGSLLGLIAGVGVGTSKFLDKLLNPLIQFLAPIPPIVWVPLLIIFFGIGETSKIVLLIVASFFVLFLNTVQGIRSTNQKFVDVANVYNKSNMDLIKKILLPSSLPNIFTGMRLALGLSWILLIAAEVVASSKGLGWLIWDARNFSRPDDMFVGIITIGCLGKLSDQILLKIEKKFTKWRDIFEGK